MDTINVLLQAISTVGFPVCAFFTSIVMLKYSFDESNRKTEKAFAELSKLSDAINNNTLTLTRLCEKVEDLSDDRR